MDIFPTWTGDEYGPGVFPTWLGWLEDLGGTLAEVARLTSTIIRSVWIESRL